MYEQGYDNYSEQDQGGYSQQPRGGGGYNNSDGGYSGGGGGNGGGYGGQRGGDGERGGYRGGRGGYRGRGGGGGYRGGGAGGAGGAGGQNYQQRDHGPSVFVGNIPWAAQEDELARIFSEFGSVVRFRILQDRNTGRPRGMGFCEFDTKESCQSAIDGLNGHDFNGRQLRVDHAKPRQ